MYPLKSGQTFARDAWYVAARSFELADALFARRILDLPVVFYRAENGDPVALLDLCPHRRFPLSKSQRIGDSIQCSYHGFTFDGSGRCTALPTGDAVPASYRVRAFPIAERWEWIWIWPGDPAKADPALIPDMASIRLEAPGWEAASIGMTTTKARHMLLHENLLDLSHLSYLHKGSVGSAGIARTRMEIEDKNGYLEITRRIRNDSMDGVPLAAALGIDGLVDRLMAQQFFAPSFHATGSAFTSAVETGREPGRYYGGFRVLHAVTPETPTSTHYFYACSRDFALGDAMVGQRLKGSIANAVVEDVFGAEQIEASLDDAASAADDLHTRADAGSMRGRLMIEKIIEAEQAARARPQLAASGG